MESGFMKGNSKNLPRIDVVMIDKFVGEPSYSDSVANKVTMSTSNGSAKNKGVGKRSGGNIIEKKSSESVVDKVPESAGREFRENIFTRAISDETVEITSSTKDITDKLSTSGGREFRKNIFMRTITDEEVEIPSCTDSISNEFTASTCNGIPKNKGVGKSSLGHPIDKGKNKNKAIVALPDQYNGNTENKSSTKNAASEKQAMKRKLEEEKAAKKRANEMNKIFKPGECMKYMNIEGHPTLWSRWYMCDVSREAAAVGAHVIQAHNLCDHNLVVWTRSLRRALAPTGGQVKLTPSEERCSRALYIASAEELCEFVSGNTLAAHLAQVQQLCDSVMTLVVFQVNDYFKSTRRKTLNSNRTPMTEIDLELAITDLLVSADIDTVKVNTPNEIALLIVQFTKAIAEAPFKKAKHACDEHADFYMRGDNKKCVAVDKDGVGVGRLWQQMLAVLPQSSLDTARALTAQYKTPLELYQAFQWAGSAAPLADIGVRRAAGGEARARRVGPEFARKLHTLFTAQRGDVRLD